MQCLLYLSALALALPTPARPADSEQRPVTQAVERLLDRLGTALPPATLKDLDAAGFLRLLNAAEREVLGSQHLRFHVNTPVTVTVLRDARLGNEPFWLADRGFHPSGTALAHGKLQFDAWTNTLPAGAVGLGVNSLAGGSEHYLVLVKPAEPTAALEITDLDPPQLKLARFVSGVKPYADRDETLATVPAEFKGQWLVRTLRARRDDARLVGLFRKTDHPASPTPDHVVLTWSGDPRTSQAVQWRTRANSRRGALLYAPRAALATPHPRPLRRVEAVTDTLRDPRLLNDPAVCRHTVELTGLDPGTTYVYAVGDGSKSGWSEFREFTTAPAAHASFSFVYMGDPQTGLDRWGSLLQSTFRERPEAAFWLIAGDLVNRGAQRDDWDKLFHNGRGVFDRRTLVPVLGNHDCQGGHPTLYLQQFALPRNGPPGIEPERAYAFDYAQARVIVLDSNLEPASQTHWLEQQLADPRPAWRIVAHHHPAFSSAPGRDNAALRQHWTPLYDKYHVDLVLQGHDHAYLRTHPLKAGQRVASPAEGTIYLLSVSGTKMYDQATPATAAVRMTKVATCQIIDLQLDGHRLLYRALDQDGTVRDQFVIDKPSSR
ncbi:MAG TPA: metallophosphoesterase family protein [Verrucomicrobiota bacterium]|nr:metallophosphoesterase family protein [Verrucomicrobiota bacterium]HNU51562.1 metallophosphoesterase family protein [Verrucomicrobiota bacterium]